MFEDGVDDQHVREAQCDARVGDGRAEAADQVRGSLACSVHNGTVRLCCHCSQADDPFDMLAKAVRDWYGR